MSPFELAALAQAQEARELAESIGEAAAATRDTAAQAQEAAATALTANDAMRKDLDASIRQVETTQAAATSAGEAARAAAGVAQSATTAAQAAGTSAEAATQAARTAGTTAQQAEQIAQRAAASAPRLFTGMAAAKLPISVNRIETNGHADAGTGAASYVSDGRATAALAAAHPLACFKGDGDRYFRLLPSPSGAITPEQMGCPATGNAQPFIQAAINYAHAMGIQRVELPGARYELWATIRNPGEHANTGLSGHYLLVRENLAIVGTGRGKSLLRCLNSQGGTNDTVTQPNMTYGAPQPQGDMLTKQLNWMGSGINVRPNTSMDFLRLENIEVDGTKTFNRAQPHDPQINLTHKALRIQDVNCSRVEMRDVVLRNWGGEIFYTAGSVGIKEEHLENCILDGSPQCTINSGTCARSTYINVEAGNSYQIEIIGGWGKTFIGCRFYDLTSLSLMGGAGALYPNGFMGGAYPFYYPVRTEGRAPPYVTFSGVTIERCNSLGLSSYAKGDLYLVDTAINLGTNFGKLTDVDLRVVSVVDAVGITEALALNGPENLTTPISTTGLMVQPASNVRVDLTCQRTEAAKSAGRNWQQAVRVYGKLFDAASVMVTVHGAAPRLALLTGTPVAGFVWPQIMAAPDFMPQSTIFGAGTVFGVSADRSITPWAGVNAIEPSAAGTFTVTLDNTGSGFVNGQVITLVHIHGNPGRIIRLPASGGGMRLQQDRYLINKADNLVLRWDAILSAWVETGYSTSAQIVMKGSATYDAPAIAAGGSTSTTITVPGAAVGDLVTALSFGNVNLQGVVARGEVTGNNTVTIWLTNPTAAAVDLPSATVRVQVTKAFAI